LRIFIVFFVETDEAGSEVLKPSSTLFLSGLEFKEPVGIIDEGYEFKGIHERSVGTLLFLNAKEKTETNIESTHFALLDRTLKLKLKGLPVVADGKREEEILKSMTGNGMLQAVETNSDKDEGKN
jgi:hypothetical protein